MPFVIVIESDTRREVAADLDSLNRVKVYATGRKGSDPDRITEIRFALVLEGNLRPDAANRQMATVTENNNFFIVRK